MTFIKRGEGPWSPGALEEDASRLAEFERTRKGLPGRDQGLIQSWCTPNELTPPKPRKL